MLINKKDMPLVDMEFMNDVHCEDIDIINELFEYILKYENDKRLINKQNIDNKYKQWIAHTIEHFKNEEILMVQKQFPPYPMHKSEHDNALNKMDEIFKKWLETEDINILKVYIIEDIPKWLVHHINTMDTITARFLKTGVMMCH